MRFKVFIILFFVLFLGNACVSVNIPKGKIEKSKGVEFVAPTHPFERLDPAAADGAWQNKSNGNSISYFSSCGDPGDPSLETVSRELFSDLRNLKVLRSENLSFNGREALDSEVEGSLDGVPTRIHSLVFKKNGCLYTLSYIGVSRAFTSDQNQFEQFLRNFRAP